MTQPADKRQLRSLDISRFMIAHLQQGGRILNADTAAKMHALAFKPPPILNGTTLGFFRMDRNGYEIIGHPGETV